MATDRSWSTFWRGRPITSEDMRPNPASRPFSNTPADSDYRVLRPDVGGFKEEFVDDVLEFSPDIGAPIRRNRTSRDFSIFTVSFEMHVKQWEIFKQFYRQYTGNGTLSFDFPNYNSADRDGKPSEEMEVQFYGGRPEMSTVGPLYRRVSFKVIQLSAPRIVQG